MLGHHFAFTLSATPICCPDEGRMYSHCGDMGMKDIGGLACCSDAYKAPKIVLNMK